MVEAETNTALRAGRLTALFRFGRVMVSTYGCAIYAICRRRLLGVLKYVIKNINADENDAEISSLLSQAEAIFNDPDAILAKYADEVVA